MEESKELQGFYKIFRTVVYVSVLLEFFEYAIDPAMLDHWGGILTDIHGRIKQWMIYHDGNLVYSKIATVLLICITCVGTRNKKHLEFNARRQVVYPLTSGLLLLVLSVWLFGHTDGNKALYLTSEYHSLYDCLHCWRSTGTYRIRQHFKVHQGGIDERPFQLRE